MRTKYLIRVLFCAFVSSIPDGDAEGVVVKRLWGFVFVPVLLLGILAGGPPAVAATGPAPWQPGDPVFNPPSASLPVVGVNYHPMWSSMTTAARADVLDALQAAGTTWVRIDVAWGTIQPNNATSYDSYGVAQVDTRIKEIRARGMKVLLMFYWAPAWSSGTTEKNGRPSKPGDYARAAAWVADRYDGTTSPDLKIDAIELWNEPDLDSFWAPAPANTRISDFAALIKAAGPAVKNANPDLTVVVGAPASVDTDWYTEFYTTPGIVGTYDALGVHPYQSPGDAPPGAYDPQYGKYYLKHIPALSQLMATHNDPARIWATEFGWSTHPNTPTTPNYQRGVIQEGSGPLPVEGDQADGVVPAGRSGVLVQHPGDRHRRHPLRQLRTHHPEQHPKTRLLRLQMRQHHHLREGRVHGATIAPPACESRYERSDGRRP